MAVRENLYFNQHELGQNYNINIIHQVFFRLNAGLGKGCEYNLSDFSKAFDEVPHVTLPNKLLQGDLHDTTVRWFTIAT